MKTLCSLALASTALFAASAPAQVIPSTPANGPAMMPAPQAMPHVVYGNPVQAMPQMGQPVMPGVYYAAPSMTPTVMPTAYPQVMPQGFGQPMPSAMPTAMPQAMPSAMPSMTTGNVMTTAPAMTTGVQPFTQPYLGSSPYVTQPYVVNSSPTMFGTTGSYPGVYSTTSPYVGTYASPYATSSAAPGFGNRVTTVVGTPVRFVRRAFRR